MLQMFLPMLLGMGGSMAGRALLARLLPSLASKAIPGLAADALGFTAGNVIGETLAAGHQADPVQYEGNGPAFSRYQSTIGQESPVSINVAEMLQEMGIDPRSMGGL